MMIYIITIHNKNSDYYKISEVYNNFKDAVKKIETMKYFNSWSKFNKNKTSVFKNYYYQINAYAVKVKGDSYGKLK